MASKYQKRHYEDVAGIFKDVLDHTHGDPHEMIVESIIQEFTCLFEDDNPLFSRERFLKACGLEDA